METVFRGKFWRTPFYQDNHPTYKESTGQAWMGWRECDKVWYIYNMQGFPQGSIASKDYQFGLDIIKMPNGDVSCPPLDPNMGSNGTCKFFCVNGNQHEAVLLLRKRKLGNLGASAKKKARPRPTQAKPRPVPEPAGPPPASVAGPSQPLGPLAFQPQAVAPPLPPPPPPPMVKERHGWLMKTKELIVAYKLKYWQVFDTLAQEQFAVHLDHAFCLFCFIVALFPNACLLST